MKKFILAAAAASLVATPVLAAPNDGPRGNDRGRIEYSQRDHAPRAQQAARYDNRGHHNARPAAYKQDQHHNWKRGDRFDQRRASHYRVINNPRSYHLNAAPRGYRWVQSGNDAVLVAIASGIIASVISNSVY